MSVWQGLKSAVHAAQDILATDSEEDEMDDFYNSSDDEDRGAKENVEDDDVAARITKRNVYLSLFF